MADKSVGELIAAQSVTPTDLFVLEQNGTAKKLTGQILENWLVSFADGHGGIQSIKKLSTSGLVDTYRITLADTTTFDFVVNNGRGITGISKTGTSGLVDTYTISYNDGTSGTLTVTNGEKGDKGDNAYIWIKYASQKPTESSHSMGDLPDDWIGIYSGNASTAPTDWKQYKWFKHKGEQGGTGAAATLVNKSVTYQVSDSGTIIPSGPWGSSIPVVSQGKYLWTKTELEFNTGDPIVSYSVARMGIDGSGSVSSVNNVSPDATGNVTLTASDVGALATSGGDMTGEIRMNGQPISGLNDPTEANQAARKGYVDAAKAAAKAYTDASLRKAAPRNLLDNSDFQNPVNQRGKTSYAGAGYTIDRWEIDTNKTTLSVVNKGIQIVNSDTTNRAAIEKLPKGTLKSGKTYTGMLELADGTLYVGSGVAGTSNVNLTPNSNDVYLQFIIGESTDQIKLVVRAGKTATVRQCAIYEGEYTAETLPEYNPKGYAAELAECQRYYLKLLTQASGFASSETAALIPVSTPVQMRTTPTVSGAVNWLRTEGTQLAASNIANAAFSASSPAGNGVAITLSNVTGLTQHKAIYIAVANFALSADL